MRRLLAVAFVLLSLPGVCLAGTAKDYAYVFDLKGRPSFDGKGPYPKDLMLCLYGTPFRGSSVWDWRTGAVS